MYRKRFFPMDYSVMESVCVFLKIKIKIKLLIFDSEHTTINAKSNSNHMPIQIYLQELVHID